MTNVFDLFDKKACDIRGKVGADSWTWAQYASHKKELEAQGIQVVLVDMIGHPVEGAIPISNEMFFGNVYPAGTYFILYCHSGGSSGYVQKQLREKVPQYHIVNMEGGIYAYQLYKMQK